MDRLAVFAQYVPLLDDGEDDVVECFDRGQGIPYEEIHSGRNVETDRTLEDE